MLNVENITLGFNGYKVIEKLSFTLDKGKIYALIGSNGAGKTTLLNLLDGQLKPTSGKITFNGEIINNWTVWKRADKGVLRTWQHGREFKNLTVLNNLLSATKHPGENLLYTLFHFRKVWEFEQNISTQAERILAKYGLTDKKDKLAIHLSLGEKRIIDFARMEMQSLTNGNKLILLDEPFSGIHINNKNIIKGVIKELAEKGYTILMVEHNTELAFSISNRVLLLNNGKIELDKTPSEIVNDSQANKIYFGKN